MRPPRRLAALPALACRPADLPPMLPVLVDELPAGPGWLYELKWDGVRALALRSGSRVELWSRGGRPIARQYPEVAAAVAALPGGDLALDGEIVALDAEGRPSFERLQRRMHLARGVARATAAVPVTAYVYDCLGLFGRDVRALPLAERKALLRKLIPAPDTLRFADHVAGDGPAFFEAVCAAGLGGVVAKRADSPYHGGRRPEWRKVKCYLRQEFVVGGWTDPKGTRAHLGALHLGFYAGGHLVYAGRVGSGLDARGLGQLAPRLRSLAADACPFTRGRPPHGRDHHWVRPELVCEVRFAEWTGDGSIRHPVYLGLRSDRRPEEVGRETPVTPRA